ncbi:MAG: hypothetical protein EP333_05395, partial [Bacteroidetes bacterium]
MDRNTVIGLVLIGLILSVFTIFNQPTEEEIKAEKAKIEQAKQVEKAKKEKADKKSAKETKENSSENLVAKLDSAGNQLVDSTGLLVFKNTVTGKDTLIEAPKNETKPAQKNVKGELVRLENEKLVIDFTTKGGQVAAVRLKNYESYDDFAKKDKEITPLLLFDEGDAINNLILPLNGKEFNSNAELFEIKEKTANAIIFLYSNNGEEIEFTYTLKPDAYDLDYDITLRGFAGKVSPQNVALDWSIAYPRTERLFSEQRRVSTICFDYKDEGFSYLSEITDDEEKAEDDINWVSYKQSYFSSFMKPDVPFSGDGSEMKVFTYPEGHEREYTNLKDFNSRLNLNLKSVDGSTARINWYFGPNDYKTLKSYDDGYDQILNYGWGLFRWINLYAVQPIFSVLKSSGMNMGIVILLLTIIIKLALMPIQWKMYTSSAKMRILKPEIDELNAKYPN